MLIALNLIVASIVVGGITGVIVHALRSTHTAGTGALTQAGHPRPAQTAPAGAPQKTKTAWRGYPTVSPSRG